LISNAGGVGGAQTNGSTSNELGLKTSKSVHLKKKLFTFRSKHQHRCEFKTTKEKKCLPDQSAGVLWLLVKSKMNVCRTTARSS